jgi:hypothetical protein
MPTPTPSVPKQRERVTTPSPAIRRKRERLRRSASHKTVAEFVEAACLDDVHAKRVLSLTRAVFGAIHAASAGIHAIGTALADGLCLSRKHAVKQVDRLLSNTGISDVVLQDAWTRRAIGTSKRLVVALDWTDFDADDQSMLVLSIAGSGRHGRAIPLVWRTVKKSELEGRRNAIEDELLVRFEKGLPDAVQVTVLADRGFGDQKLYVLLRSLGLDYIIRFRGLIKVASVDGETRPAKEWLAPAGRSRKLSNVRVTSDGTPVNAFVCAHHKGMKEAWFLASSRADLTAAETVSLYGRRFTIEEQFRDVKDSRYGLGLSYVSISICQRRDRLFFICVLAESLLTLLGQAAEETGLDRQHKTNTSPQRQSSLFRQGLYWYRASQRLDRETLALLMTAFGRLLLMDAVFVRVLGLEK